MILIIDNYDSFTYNLVQFCCTITTDIKVVRNDSMTAEEIQDMHPDRIILSPGPGYPKDAGVCEEVIAKLKGQVPILGVCLGHQAICEAFGGKIVHAKELMHGKKSDITVDNNCGIFSGLPRVIPCARYHSLIADRDTLPKELKVIAEDEIGEIMAVKHRDYSIYGLQFHPESILTENGITMLKNFIEGID